MAVFVVCQMSYDIRICGKRAALDIPGLLQQADRMGGDPLTGSGEAKPLLGGCLDADSVRSGTKNRCHISPHGRDEGSQLGSLGDHGDIHIPDPVPRLHHPVSYLGSKAHTVRTFIGRITVRKQVPDVSKTQSTEDSVHDRMEQDIRITVSQKTLLIRHRHAAQDQGPAFGQAVYIVPVPDPHESISSSSGADSSGRGISNSSPAAFLASRMAWA